MANRQPRALFSSDCDGVFVDELSDVLKANWRFVELHLVIVGERVNQVRRRNRLRHTVLPAATLNKVVEEKRDDVIRLDKSAVLVNNTEAIGVAVGRDDDLRTELL